jgi:hypothetical protein
MKFSARISVFGGREINDDIYADVVDLGSQLAKNNYLVFCGGGSGVMEAISKGVALEKGICVGLLKGESVDEANPYLSIPVVTNMGITRNSLLAYNCDVAIAISGKYGTLSEIAYALQLGKPIIAFKTWNIPGTIEVNSITEIIKAVKDILKQ